jgi:hypothetical protein
MELEEIITSINKISETIGEDSVETKIGEMAWVFRQASSPDELRYLVRSFSGSGLRIGLSNKIVENIVLDHF